MCVCMNLKFKTTILFNQCMQIKALNEFKI